jgi:hypothetical protein
MVERLNHWLALIGNLGVIAGIVFLAYEIQANTNAVRSATYQAFNDSSFSWADSAIENAAIMAKAAANGSLAELSPKERIIWDRFMFKTFTVMESNYLHHRAGSMDDDVFESKISGSIGAILNEPLWIESWNRAGFLLPECKEDMNSRLRATKISGS